jgi:hypothetical protein
MFGAVKKSIRAILPNHLPESTAENPPESGFHRVSGGSRERFLPERPDLQFFTAPFGSIDQ